MDVDDLSDHATVDHDFCADDLPNPKFAGVELGQVGRRDHDDPTNQACRLISLNGSVAVDAREHPLTSPFSRFGDDAPALTAARVDKDDLTPSAEKR